ncbi:hypothetical protein ACET3Z_029807 [Daucus carota]
MLKVGPIWCNGTTWDHRGKTDIAQIFISRCEKRINFIQFVYCEDGGNKLVLSEKIGGDGDSGSLWLDSVTFDYPSEYITRVSGKYENIYSTKYLRSITFDTNRGRYGPFEAAPAKDSLEDTEFRYEVGRSKFGGFFGAFTSTGINSIGIYVKPLEKLVITPVKEE